MLCYLRMFVYVYARAGRYASVDILASEGALVVIDAKTAVSTLVTGAVGSIRPHVSQLLLAELNCSTPSAIAPEPRTLTDCHSCSQTLFHPRKVSFAGSCSTACTQ